MLGLPQAPERQDVLQAQRWGVRQVFGWQQFRPMDDIMREPRTRTWRDMDQLARRNRC